MMKMYCKKLKVNGIDEMELTIKEKTSENSTLETFFKNWIE